MKDTAVCIIDETGKIVVEDKVRSDPAAITQFFNSACLWMFSLGKHFSFLQVLHNGQDVAIE